MKKPKPETDGRRLRSERSRQLIIDAMFALVDEGNLVPTAQQVAERANVGIRSVFRHFNDMESLFVTFDSHNRESIEAKFLGGDRTGSISERITKAVERRSSGFEHFRNLVLSTQAQLWRYEVLRKNYARNQRGLRKDLLDWLPEIGKLSAQRREAAEAIASFETWHRLREHQGLSKRASAAVVVDMLEMLLK